MEPTEIFKHLGPKYTQPRDIQVQLASEVCANLRELNMVEAPTGIGKSALALCIGEMIESRLTVINTATISLQDQYDQDFPSVCKLIGRSNFDCTITPGVSAAEAPCVADPTLSCNSGWYEQEREFRLANTVVTNYALYLSELMHGRRWHTRRPTLLVCDEGHRLLDFLSQAETIKLDLRLASKLGLTVNGVSTLVDAKDWCATVGERVRRRAYSLLSSGSRWAGDWLTLTRQISNVADAPDNLIVTREGDRFEATPLWPRISGRRLLSSAEHLLVMSATLWGGEFFAELLGYDAAYAYHSAPSPFDSWRWPVYYKPVRNMNKASTPADWAEMGRVCHEYMHSRTGDKGIIHVASNAQADKVSRAILHCYECRGRLVLLRTGRRRAETIDQFRCGRNTWIIHPSIGEGESFDDEACRIQLIAKVRYPGLSDPLVKMRASDKGLGSKFYFNSTAAYTAQTVGRGMRHEGDYCETYILDGSFGSLYDKNKEAFPQWFHAQLR